MFQDACKSLVRTVIPLIVVTRRRNGQVKSSMGAAMFINQEGWFVTAGHLLSQIRELDRELQATQSKRKQKGGDLTHYSFLLGGQNSPRMDAFEQPAIDLAIGKSDNISPPPDYVLPKFRVNKVEAGEFLCRVGFPFIDNIKPSWNKDKGFKFGNIFPVPMFVNEALVSRFVDFQGGTWIETSSPGLQGQSGGPLVDTKGNICGIQVNTAHYPLGFRGPARNQFLNVGRAVHSKNVMDFMNQHKIQYLMED